MGFQGSSFGKYYIYNLFVVAARNEHFFCRRRRKDGMSNYIVRERMFTNMAKCPKNGRKHLKNLPEPGLLSVMSHGPLKLGRQYKPEEAL